MLIRPRLACLGLLVAVGIGIVLHLADAVPLVARQLAQQVHLVRQTAKQPVLRGPHPIHDVRNAAFIGKLHQRPHRFYRLDPAVDFVALSRLGRDGIAQGRGQGRHVGVFDGVNFRLRPYLGERHLRQIAVGNLLGGRWNHVLPSPADLLPKVLQLTGARGRGFGCRRWGSIFASLRFGRRCFPRHHAGQRIGGVQFGAADGHQDGVFLCAKQHQRRFFIPVADFDCLVACLAQKRHDLVHKIGGIGPDHIPFGNILGNIAIPGIHGCHGHRSVRHGIKGYCVRSGLAFLRGHFGLPDLADKLLRIGHADGLLVILLLGQLVLAIARHDIAVLRSAVLDRGADFHAKSHHQAAGIRGNRLVFCRVEQRRDHRGSYGSRVLVLDGKWIQQLGPRRLHGGTGARTDLGDGGRLAGWLGWRGCCRRRGREHGGGAGLQLAQGVFRIQQGERAIARHFDFHGADFLRIGPEVLGCRPKCRVLAVFAGRNKVGCGINGGINLVDEVFFLFLWRHLCFGLGGHWHLDLDAIRRVRDDGRGRCKSRCWRGWLLFVWLFIFCKPMWLLLGNRSTHTPNNVYCFWRVWYLQRTSFASKGSRWTKLMRYAGLF